MFSTATFNFGKGDKSIACCGQWICLPYQSKAYQFNCLSKKTKKLLGSRSESIQSTWCHRVIHSRVNGQFTKAAHPAPFITAIHKLLQVPQRILLGVSNLPRHIWGKRTIYYDLGPLTVGKTSIQSGSQELFSQPGINLFIQTTACFKQFKSTFCGILI